MDFALNNEQIEFVNVVRRFSLDHVADRVTQYDRSEQLPEELVRRAADLGLVGGVVPAKYGGTGLDYLTLTVAIEELSKVDHTLAAIVSAPSGLVGSGLLRFGSEDQKRRYLRPLARGETTAGAAVTEPDSGTDVAGMKTRVHREGDSYVLNGTKMWISNLNNASWFITFAQADRSRGKDGISAFIVERAAPGVGVHPVHNKTGFRPLVSGELVFRDVRVPAENRIGQEGEGLRVAMCAVETGRLFVAARAVGVLQACLDQSIQYARSRTAFGKEIGRFQLIQSKIADMAVATETARLLTHKLAWLKDQGKESARIESSMAKLYASDALMEHAVQAAQIFGAYSASDEYPVSRHFRDAKFFQIVEGTNEIHRVLIAETLLGFRA